MPFAILIRKLSCLAVLRSLLVLRSFCVLALVAVCLIAASVEAMPSSATPRSGDYDGDGRSDLSVSIVYRDSGTSAWLTRLATGGFLFWTFPIAADAFVAGHYFGDNRFYPGAVIVRSAQQPLEWRIKTPNGGEIALAYGLPGDTVVNQQDVDCDGITDFVVTRNGTPTYYPGFKLWYTALSGSGGQVVETVFGLADDKPGLADMDGDGCSELVVLRPNTYTWFAKKLNQTEYSAVQWGLNGDIPLWPTDLNNDGKADYIVTRRTGLLQQAFVRYGNGPNDFETFTLGFDSSIPQVGNFLGVPFFTWHQRDTGWVALGDRSKPGNIGELKLFGIAQNFIIRADGSVVPPHSDGRFPETSSGGNGGGGSTTGCDVDTDFRDGPHGALWKPISETTGLPVFLLGSEYWNGPKGVNKIEIFSSTNTLVATGSRRGCCPNGGRAHFGVSISAAALSPSAPINVVLTLNNGQRECRRVADPMQRVD